MAEWTIKQSQVDRLLDPKNDIALGSLRLVAERVAGEGPVAGFVLALAPVWSPVALGHGQWVSSAMLHPRNGLRQRRRANLAKSWSVEQSSAPCWMARAAR